MQEGLIAKRECLKVGDPTEYDTFMGAVIDKVAFARIKKHVDRAKATPEKLKIISGGRCDDR